MNSSVKRVKQQAEKHWLGITGWTDAQERECTGATRRKAENPNVRKSYSPVDPMHHITSVGLTGDRKNRVQKRFSARDLWELRWLENQIKSKGVVNMWTFCRHDHKGLVNMSMKGIDESLHGLGGIEEFPSKNGVFSRTQLRFGGTRDSGGYSTRLEGFESLQRVTKSSRINPLTRAHESIKENRNSIKRDTR